MIIDLSQNITDKMPVYPGDIEVSLKQTNFLNTDKYNSYRIEMNMHAGTHIDGPMHLTDGRGYISELSLDSFIGNGCVLVARDYDKCNPKPIIQYKPEYESQINENDIVLIYTGHDKYYGKSFYYDSHPTIGEDLSEFLIRKRIKMVGIDMPSPDYPPFRIHKAFLGAGIFIIENLTGIEKLLGVSRFEILAFPLKIDADSSPARVSARF